MRGHEEKIRNIVFAKDGKFILTASIDGTVKLWNIEIGLLMATLYSHGEPVDDLIISEQQDKIVSVSRGGKLIVWSLLENIKIASFHGDGPLKCCMILSDGKTICVGEESGRVHFLKLENEALVCNKKKTLYPEVYESSRNQLKIILKKFRDILVSEANAKEKILYIEKYQDLIASVQYLQFPFLDDVKKALVLNMGDFSDDTFSKKLRHSALIACVKCGVNILPIMAEQLKKRPWKYFANIVVAAAAIAPFDPGVLSLVEYAMKDQRPSVRAILPEAIMHYETPKFLAIIENLISDDNPKVRLAAEKAVLKWKNEIDPSKKFWSDDQLFFDEFSGKKTSKRITKHKNVENKMSYQQWSFCEKMYEFLRFKDDLKLISY